MAIERISRVSLRCDTCGLCYATAPARAGTREELRLRASFEGWSTGPKADLCALCADARARKSSVQRHRAWGAVIRALRAEPGPDGLPSWSLLEQAVAAGATQTCVSLGAMVRLGVVRRVRTGQVIQAGYDTRVLAPRFALRPEENWPAWCRALFSSAVDDPEQPEHEYHAQDHAQRRPAPIAKGAVTPATENDGRHDNDEQDRDDAHGRPPKSANQSK